ncbi:MAG: nuclear transport factor 2 family protein [Thermomicrobiales bacterium]
MSANSDVLHAMYAAMAEGNVPGVLAMFDPGIDWTEAEGFMTEGHFIGPDAVVQGVFGPLFAEFPDFAVTPHEIIDGGERLVSLGTYSGTHAKTGKSFKAAFAHVWTISEGKATTFRQFVDNAPVEAARHS